MKVWVRQVSVTAWPSRHGRIKGLKTPVAAFVRLAKPIPFEAPDGKPVNLLFFLLIPNNVTQQHLEILSEIAAMFSDGTMPDIPVE